MCRRGALHILLMDSEAPTARYAKSSEATSIRSRFSLPNEPAGEGQPDVCHPRPRQANRVRRDAHVKRGGDVQQDAAEEQELAHERLAQLHNNRLRETSTQGWGTGRQVDTAR